MEKAYTTKEVATILRISKWTIYSWVRNGKLHPYKYSRNLFFKKSEIDALTGDFTEGE